MTFEEYAEIYKVVITPKNGSAYTIRKEEVGWVVSGGGWKLHACLHLTDALQAAHELSIQATMRKKMQHGKNKSKA